MKLYFIYISISFILVIPSYSQSNLINGQVIDEYTKDPLIFARVYDPKNNKLYVTDLEGKFKVGLKEGDTSSLYTSYTGYLNKLSIINYKMESVIITLESPKPGGVTDFATQKQYYQENKLEIDSLKSLFQLYDEIMKDLKITKFDQHVDLYINGKKVAKDERPIGSRPQKTE